MQKYAFTSPRDVCEYTLDRYIKEKSQPVLFRPRRLFISFFMLLSTYIIKQVRVWVRLKHSNVVFIEARHKFYV